MRKSLVLVTLIVVLAVVPSMVCAQALFGKKCKDDANKFFITGAWVHSFNTHYGIDRNTLFLGTRTWDWSYNYDAFQVGLGLPIALGDEGQYGAFTLSGTAAIPSTHQGEELVTDGAAPPTTIVTRKWDADTYYATVEGLYAYPVYSAWYALAGFRWIYWQTSYSNPYDDITSAPTDTGDVTVNGYVPFVGVMTSVGGLSVGAIGVPTTLGTVEHKEDINAVNRIVGKADLNGGYFAEVFINYSTPTFEMPGLSAGISLFCKANWLRATAIMSVEDLSQPLVTPRDFDFVLTRNLFYLGAKATFDFDLPSWPSSRILYY